MMKKIRIQCAAIWYKDGKQHREDGPAVITKDGTKQWMVHGKRHRDGGPAVEGKNGYETWWIHDRKIEGQELVNLKRLYKLETFFNEE